MAIQLKNIAHGVDLINFIAEQHHRDWSREKYQFWNLSELKATTFLETYSNDFVAMQDDHQNFRWLEVEVLHPVQPSTTCTPRLSWSAWDGVARHPLHRQNIADL
jgi:hypothetical protein